MNKEHLKTNQRTKILGRQSGRDPPLIINIRSDLDQRQRLALQDRESTETSGDSTRREDLVRKLKGCF